jgi:glutamate racemase
LIRARWNAEWKQHFLTPETMKATGTALLGVIDWGIGGISIARLVKSQLGDVPLVYLSDTGVTPYGRMSRGELVARLNTVIGFLRSQGVTHLVIGCNAASTVIPFLSVADLKIEGVIKSAVRLTERLRPARLALIGGRRTVLSGVYRRALADRGIQLTQRIAQPLSALVERGDLSSLELREQCRKILSPIRNCSHLLLACTHYPAITSALRQFVSQKTVLLDPARELTSAIARWKLPTGGTDTFFTTGDPEKMKAAARAAFGFKIKAARKIAL